MARHDGKGITGGQFLGGFFAIIFVVMIIVMLVEAVKPEQEFTTTDVEFGTKVYADVVSARPEYESTDDEIFCRCKLTNGTFVLIRFSEEDFARYFDADPDKPDPMRNYTPIYDIRIHGDMRHSEPDSQLEGNSWIYCSSVEIIRD